MYEDLLRGLLAAQNAADVDACFAEVCLAVGSQRTLAAVAGTGDVMMQRERLIDLIEEMIEQANA